MRGGDGDLEIDVELQEGRASGKVAMKAQEWKKRGWHWWVCHVQVHVQYYAIGSNPTMRRVCTGWTGAVGLVMMMMVLVFGCMCAEEEEQKASSLEVETLADAGWQAQVSEEARKVSKRRDAETHTLLHAGQMARVVDQVASPEMISAVRDEALALWKHNSLNDPAFGTQLIFLNVSDVQDKTQQARVEAEEAAKQPTLLYHFVRRLKQVAFGHDAALSASVVGCEVWQQVRETDAEMHFHYDKDEHMYARYQRLRHPFLSTVTYLSDHGGPTLALDTFSVRQGARVVNRASERAAVVYPSMGKHLMFRGDQFHGIAGALATPRSVQLKGSGPRVTLLVNWWRTKPMSPGCHYLYKPEAVYGLKRDMELQQVLEAQAAWMAKHPRIQDAPVHLVDMEHMDDKEVHCFWSSTSLDYVEVCAPRVLPAFAMDNALGASNFLLHYPPHYRSVVVQRLDPRQAVVRSVMYSSPLPRVYLFVADGEVHRVLHRLAPVIRHYAPYMHFYVCLESEIADTSKELQLEAGSVPNAQVHYGRVGVIPSQSSPRVFRMTGSMRGNVFGARSLRNLLQTVWREISEGQNK